MTNYAALGELTAFSRQAKDAASRRYALLNNLSIDLKKLCDATDSVIEESKFTQQMQEIVKADKEMRAAVERANQAAALCGEDGIIISRLINIS